MNNLIGISGKIGSGKDTVGKIFQHLAYKKQNSKYKVDIETWIEYDLNESHYQIKKFADKLKEIVCLLIGCTREQLEDRKFKNTELGKEWWYYGAYQHGSHYDKLESIHVDKKDAEYILEYSHMNRIELIKLTPRKLLQLLGTECGRDIIHPNIWVNALFSDYKAKGEGIKDNIFSTPNGNVKMQLNPLFDGEYFPNWIITDVRFPNEAQSIKDRGGILIRVNRNASELERCLKDPVYFVENYTTVNGNKINLRNVHKSFILEYFTYKKEHPSETALDDYEFDYVIDNNDSIDELVEKVKQLKLI